MSNAWEGRVSLKEDARGVPTVMANPTGNYDATNAPEFVADLITGGFSINTYSVSTPEKPKSYPKSGVWSAADLAKFAKQADRVELVASKPKLNRKTGRWFRTPVLAFIKDDAQTPKPEATKGVLL